MTKYTLIEELENEITRIRILEPEPGFRHGLFKAIQIVRDRPPLFRFGAFTSHSGVHLPDKIDCDALTPADWDTMAAWVARHVDFKAVVGIPSGGLAFAAALQQHCQPKGCTLIVDDVLTTGASMEEARKNVEGLSCGVVVFARGKLPNWVIARFTEFKDE